MVGTGWSKLVAGLLVGFLSLLGAGCAQCGTVPTHPLPGETERELVDLWMSRGLPYRAGCGFDQEVASTDCADFEASCNLEPACGAKPTDMHERYVGCSYTCGANSHVAYYLHGFESRLLTAHEWAHYMLGCTVPSTDGDAAHAYPGVWTGPDSFVQLYGEEVAPVDKQ